MLKTILATVALAIGTTAIAAPASAQVNERQERQKERIVNGVKQGDLTSRETGRLVRQQARIQRYETRSRNDGPGYTPRERVRTQKMQNRASRSIFRQRNDRQRRPR